ncbi:peptidylprolyl isomerase [Evansella sp. LMS18]|uniref:peptidylprolyl isomerase n=1 Tax=Evansella sp. LMS18 TaxID=2924033 RepID=UPI0020D004F2|nr:peptidylprolyl isomerase [Evansella sp. LMS18]UTR10704.1 peptidylprolyl isomerase [Evansella sp. LMS18]
MKKLSVPFTMLISLSVLLAACGDNNGNQEDFTDGNNDNLATPPAENEDSQEEGNPAEELPLERAEAPDDYPQFNEEAADSEEVIVHTNMGGIHLRLFPQFAPLAVENFLTLSEDGFYDGVTFHRILDGFMIQGGDPTGSGMGGESIYDGPFEDEFTTALAHFRGALSMANSGPNTNSSQFFIVQADEEGLSEEYFDMLEEEGMVFPEETVERYLEVGGTPHLDFGHTVFGHVVDGMDVVDEIAAVETDQQGRPEEEVIIESVEILD